MSAAGWLGERGEGVPGELERLLLARVESANETASTAATEMLIRAAHEQLTRVLDATPMTRAQALDLLAADAFATYALEAAADDPASLADRADAAMRLFAEAGPQR